MRQALILGGLLIATPVVGGGVGVAIGELLLQTPAPAAPQNTVPFLAQERTPTAEPFLSSAQSFVPPPLAKVEKPVAPPVVTTPPRRSGILDLQPFQTSQSAMGRNGTPYRLVQPNPHANGWALLQRGGANPVSAHLENPFPDKQRIDLAEDGLALSLGSRKTMCRWEESGVFEPAQAALTPICDGRLWLRTARRGFRTRQDSIVEALRSLGDLGEGLINFYKSEIHKDALAEAVKWQTHAQAVPVQSSESLPLPAWMQANTQSVPVQHDKLGIALSGVKHDAPLALGNWYPAAHHPGVAVSIAIPGRIAAALLDSYKERVSPLEEVEATSLVYLLAFDLDRYEANYRLGTDHPAVDWSRRAIGPQEGPGPDGFATLSPFVRVGMVTPYQALRLTAVLSGGFKREHGAFKYGALARIQQGSHYGFMEEGVILSQLQPGLASVIGRLDGGLELKSWDRSDLHRLKAIRFVRQNGVPLIETAEPGRPGIPGRLVNRWGEGNWSGALSVSVDRDGTPQRGGTLRALRSGVCLQTGAKNKRWLIYGWFTAATPSAMARIFQAYRCDYALHLDMNSADLTYAALYRRSDDRLYPEYLNQSMAQAEPSAGHLRYVTANDSRDFFALLQKKP